MASNLDADRSGIRQPPPCLSGHMHRRTASPWLRRTPQDVAASLSGRISIMRKTPIAQALTLGFSTLLLSACGGGGSDDPASPHITALQIGDLVLERPARPADLSPQRAVEERVQEQTPPATSRPAPQPQAPAAALTSPAPAPAPSGSGAGTSPRPVQPVVAPAPSPAPTQGTQGQTSPAPSLRPAAPALTPAQGPFNRSRPRHPLPARRRPRVLTARPLRRPPLAPLQAPAPTPEPPARLLRRRLHRHPSPAWRWMPPPWPHCPPSWAGRTAP